MSTIGNNLNLNSANYSHKANNSLQKVNNNIADETEKLSTGKSVNKIEQDAVSYISAKKLDGSIAGLEQSLQDTSSSRMEDFMSDSLIAHSSTRSTLIDTDFAKAQAEQIRNTIIQESSTSALAQANLSAQSVLSFI